MFRLLLCVLFMEFLSFILISTISPIFSQRSKRPMRRRGGGEHFQKANPLAMWELLLNFFHPSPQFIPPTKITQKGFGVPQHPPRSLALLLIFVLHSLTFFGSVSAQWTVNRSKEDWNIHFLQDSLLARAKTICWCWICVLIYGKNGSLG